MRRGAAALFLAALAGCGYSPNPVEGKLFCNPGDGPKCPEGYFCRSDLKCWKSTPGDLYVGTWTFTSGAKDQTCQGGSHDSASPVGETIVVDYATDAQSNLTVDYYCVWDVNVGGPGSSTTLRSGQSCPYTDPGTNTMFLYRGSSFAFSTKDGTSATMTSAIPFDYKNADGTSGSCNFNISGQLTSTP
jgi:hypothetical protein